MYKLIIVDDEEEVRKGIIQKIEWNKFNFEIGGEAENGREALDLIEENVPDVVITDITMPLMDGLELAAILKESYPTIKTVILTGFDDFKFAQQAIKYGVADYLLKPVVPRDIDELIEKLENQIDSEIAQKEDIVMLRRHYNESLPVIKGEFLSSLITGKPDANEVKNRAAGYNLRLGGDIFIVAAASLDGKSFSNNVFEENDIELVRFAVLNISREIIEKNSFGEVFFHDENLIIIAGFQGCEKTSILAKSFSTLEEIRQNVEKYLKISITIGLGSMCNSLSKLRGSYRTALAALDYKLIIGENKVIFIEDMEPQTTDNVAFDEGKEKALISSIKFGTQDDVKKVVDALINDISSMKASFKDYQMYLMEVTAAINKLSRNFQLNAGEIFGRNVTLYEEVLRLKSLDSVRNWIEEICIKLMNHISDKRQNTTEMLLEKAKYYIKNNFGDSDLSIQKLADHLHISPSYMSMIFKKDAGLTFLKYLVNIRLEAAKELLGYTDLKTSEIAEKIGYPEINYFSYFFKKNFGMSPREYRNKLMLKKES
ncbi:MAG TPA: response regulator [Clostridia bacterium]|nr:response regulator [Clostridia bacterium]